MWDLNSLTRDRSPVPWVARRVLNQWAPREAPRHLSCSPSLLSSARLYLSWGARGPHSTDQHWAYFLLRKPDNWMVQWLYSCSGFLVPSRTRDLRNVWLGGQEITGSAESVHPGIHGLFLFRRSVVSDSLPPHGLQHARLPCPSLSPGVCSKQSDSRLSQH